MTYHFFPLTKEEAATAVKTGFTYMMENKSRWIESADLSEINTYDRGTTHVVFNGVPYLIYKDYLDITNKQRIYVGKPSLIGSDN